MPSFYFLHNFLSALHSHPFWTDATVGEAKAEGGDGNGRERGGGSTDGWPEDSGQADLWGLPQEFQHEQGQGSNHSHRQNQQPCMLSKSSELMSVSPQIKVMPFLPNWHDLISTTILICTYWKFAIKPLSQYDLAETTSEVMRCRSVTEIAWKP